MKHTAEVDDQRRSLRFHLILLGIYLFFAVLLLAAKAAFGCVNWPSLRAADPGLLASAFWHGLRFTAAALAYLLFPALLMFYAAALTGWGWPRHVLLSYLVVITLLVPLIAVADVQYFDECGKHIGYEATAYLNPSGVPIVWGAFQTHPWLCSLSLVVCAACAVASFLLFRRWLKIGLPATGTRGRLTTLWIAPFWIGLSVLAIRGGLQGRPLHLCDASISINPYVNALCLDAVYAVVRTATLPYKPAYHFYPDTESTRVTRQLLGETPECERPDYPLQRQSPGIPGGNRRNVVLFILESWSGKDTGVLGGPPGVTPFFDRLAGQSAFFDRFYATGLRTAEGIFSILCSFPNQPVEPVLRHPQALSNHWRPLSTILAEAGYENIFLHGRDLGFDNVKRFVSSIAFHQVIDRDNFPASAPRLGGAWPGYNDDTVMRRAHEEFVKQTRPFLGVIYTLNTHPPFMVPEDYPLLFPPTSIANRFLNSLNYSDHTLELFFDLARTQPYFTNTVFIMVADHARTRDTFNFNNQHWIPLLIYAPGFVPAKTHHTVGSQLDILPTVLGLLNLKTTHSAWGQDLLQTPEERGFAVSVAGTDLRWHDARYLLNDPLSKQQPPSLFDLKNDPGCKTDLSSQEPAAAAELQKALRAYLSLSQTVLYQDRVYDWSPPKIKAASRH